MCIVSRSLKPHLGNFCKRGRETWWDSDIIFWRKQLYVMKTWKSLLYVCKEEWKRERERDFRFVAFLYCLILNKGRGTLFLYRWVVLKFKREQGLLILQSIDMMVFSSALLGFLLMTEKYESREKIDVPVLEPGFLLYLLEGIRNAFLINLPE